MRAHAAAVLSIVLLAAAGVAHADDPVAPDTVRKQRLSRSQVRITWADRSTDEDGFEILRRTITDPNFQTRGTVGPDVTEFVDDDAPRSPIFIYQVRSFRDEQNSELSNLCYVNRPAPAVPGSFRVRLIALHVVRVSWSDLANGERGFDLQRAPLGSTKFKTVARIDPNTETFDDYTLEPATSYVYRMRTLGRPNICWGDSGFTPERAVTTKGGVRILQIELSGRGEGRVTSEPAGISCGLGDDHCAAEFPLSIDVVITAKAKKTTSHFARWTGYPRCEDTKEPCTVYMNEDRVIGATFRLNR